MKYIAVLFVSLILAFNINCYGSKNNGKPIRDGYEITINNITTTVQFITADIVRIYKVRDVSKISKINLIILNIKDTSLKVSVFDSGNIAIVSTASLKVSVNKRNGAISFLDNDHNLLLSENRFVLQFDRINDSVTHVSESFNLTPDEAIYGLGQHQNGKMNQRNQTILLNQRNMDIAIPFLQSTKGYGILWNNYSATIYSSQLDKLNLTSKEGDCIDYYFCKGKNADEIIGDYRELTGATPMFPLWFFGYVQSRERYKSQEQVLNVVKKYRALKVPLDVIVQDWQYWGSGDDNWNGLMFNNPNYPNAETMIDSIHLMHAKIMISVWPSFGSNTLVYQDMKKNGMLLNFLTFPESKNVKVYDAFNPKARKIYWNYMDRNLFSKGIDGWWLDATEPEKNRSFNNDEVDKSNRLKKYPYQTQVTKGVKTFLGDYNDFTNLFPYETVNGVYTNQRKTTSNKRVVILTRSAFAGQQRDASIVWSGDVTSSWQTLKNQIPAALNFTLSGMPYWNSDIGGFFSGKYPKGNKSLLFRELYIRWLQFATFTGMMRSHGTSTPREIYQFGKPGDIAFDIIKKYIGLRYKLEPYIYSNAWKITSKNASLMRPLVMDYPKDKKINDLGSEYLFGNSLLVAPVTDSIFPKGTSKLDTTSIIKTKIYLPGGQWYNFFTDERINGGRVIEQVSTISQMPVFVKAGSIIPMAGVAQYSTIRNFKSLKIEVYPGKDATFDLYEDEGDNYDYENGKYSIIEFRWNENGKTLSIDRTGGFKGMIRSRVFYIDINGYEQKRIVQYNGGKVVIKF